MQEALISLPYTIQRHRPEGTPAEHAGSSLTLSALLSALSTIILAAATLGIPILDAILQLLPVDDFVPEALFRATVKGDPDKLDPVHREMIAVCEKRAPGHKLVPLAGDAFYDRVKSAYAIVATSEPRLYGNIIIRKGVIYP